jgi:hypothetical protein
LIIFFLTKVKNRLQTTQLIGPNEYDFTILNLLSFSVYFIGNLFDSASSFSALFSIDIYVKYDFILIAGHSLFYVTHSVKLFIYYYFNKHFRRVFRETFFRNRNKVAAASSNNKNMMRPPIFRCETATGLAVMANELA